MKYEITNVGPRLEAIGNHSGYRIRMSTLAKLPPGLEHWPVSVHVRGSESEDEAAVDVPRRRLNSPDQAFEYGYECATLYIDALDHRLT